MLLDQEDCKKIEKQFFTWFGIKGNKVSDKQFLEILRLCWKYHRDMNFDNNPDYEDLEWIRNTDYKYQCLNSLIEYGIEKKLEQEIKQIFERKSKC